VDPLCGADNSVNRFAAEGARHSMRPVSPGVDQSAEAEGVTFDDNYSIQHDPYTRPMHPFEDARAADEVLNLFRCATGWVPMSRDPACASSACAD
jgi:hypothetical protein